MGDIKDIIKSVVNSYDLELDNIEYITHGKRWILRIYIDREGGVTLDDCTKVSARLSRILDAEDAIPHAYLLEVSSPGLDRLLKRMEDFVKYKGRLIKINTKIPFNKMTSFRGRIISAEMEAAKITIETEDNNKIEILFSDIAKARLEVEF